MKMELDYWPASVKFLGEAKFLEKLLAYDKDNISEKTIKALKKYVDDPDFSPERMERISIACQGLCKWVIAIEKFYHANKVVVPKKIAAKEA